MFRIVNVAVFESLSILLTIYFEYRRKYQRQNLLNLLAMFDTWASECSDVKNYKWRLNPIWHIWQQWASKGYH